MRYIWKRKVKKILEEYNFYTKGEEIANAITYGVSAILAIIRLVFSLIFAVKAKDTYKIVGVITYSSIILYFDSSLYHSLPGKTTKRIFIILDHSSIYLVIAGTYIININEFR